MMNTGEAIGVALTRLGVHRVFGVVGSGNFHVTNGLVKGGAEFVASRHEGGAATMADAYTRMSGELSVLSVHQGCGLTNAMTGIGEAAKSRTPLLVVTGETRDPASNFYIDQDALARSVGAVSLRIRSASTAIADTRTAFARAVRDRRTVVLNLPIDIQEEPMDEAGLAGLQAIPLLPSPAAAAESVQALAELLKDARRPVFIAGRGARGAAARDALVRLAEQVGALLAEGAVAKGLFGDHPWSIGVSGGFSSPLAAELIRAADVVVGWGSTLNMWTTGRGRLLGPDARIVQVDLEADAIGRNRPIALGIVGDVAATAHAAADRLTAEGYHGDGFRSPEVKQRVVKTVRWRNVPFEDKSTGEAIDPRKLSIRLDDLIPQNRIVGVDSGNFMGHPSMYLRVPDEDGFAFTQAFQSIGLGLATAIGAALARPDRFPVAACGDGGFLMGIAELETAVRLKLGMLIVVYNDHAYGAEAYHFGPAGYPVDTVTFPETDIAAIARGYGADGLTVHCEADLKTLANLISSGLTRPLVVDAKVVGMASWWLTEAMSNH